MSTLLPLLLSLRPYIEVPFHSSLRKITNKSLYMNYVDVHAHLTHEQFRSDVDAVINKCVSSGLQYIVCNGLEPVSNREVLQMSVKYPHILPALGKYFILSD